MSDQKLRALERRWKETGSVEDEAAHLLERVRHGTLSPRDLIAGALLGDPAHGRAFGGIDPALLGDETAIMPGKSIGPFYIGMTLAYFPAIGRLPLEQRRTVMVYRAPAVWFFSVDGVFTQILATDGFPGAFMGTIRVGSTFEELEEVAGPVVEDDEDNLVLERHPGIAFEGNSDGRIAAMLVFNTEASPP